MEEFTKLIPLLGTYDLWARLVILACVFVIVLILFLAPRHKTGDLDAPVPNQQSGASPTMQNQQVSGPNSPNIIGNNNTVSFHKADVYSSDTQLVVDQCSILNYPMPVIDFRVHNPGPVSISINRVYLKILDVRIGPSEVAGQEPSDVAHTYLDNTVKEGDVLVVDIAISVQPGQPDRGQIKFGWVGTRPLVSYYYIIIPAFSTPNGIVQGQAVKLVIQEDWSKPDHGKMNGQPVQGPMVEITPDEAKTQVNWVEEAKRAREVTKDRLQKLD